MSDNFVSPSDKSQLPNALTDYRLRQRDYLLRIAHAINARLDLPEVLALVIRYAVEMTNGQAGVIALRQAEERFKVVASYQLQEEYFHHLDPLLDAVPLAVPDEGRTDGAWQSPQMEAASKQLARHLPRPFEQVVALPLVAKGEMQGVLFIFRSEGAALFTPLDDQLLSAFTDQAAIAIQNANLYAALSNQADELRLLYDFSVSLARAPDAATVFSLTLDYVTRVRPAEWAAILQADESGRAILRSHSLEEGELWLDAQAVAALEEASTPLMGESEPARFDARAANPPLPPVLGGAGFQAALALPIRGPSRPLGLLWVASRQPLPYEEEAVRLLLTLTHYLGLTLDKFTLFERLAARERQLSTVVERNPAGVLLLDQTGRLLLQNPVAEVLTGVAAASSGAPLGELLALEDEAGRPLPLPLPRGAETTTVQGYLRRSDGARGSYIQVSLTSLMGGSDNEQKIEGYVVNVVDLTALKEAESAKSVFLAGLSHELKTPLALIRGYAETLRYPQAREDPALFEESLDVILAETTHLTEMVNQLLLAARLQAGALELEWDEVAVDALVRQVVEAFRQTHPAYRWQLTLDEALPTITADPVRLREVLHNLLSNAAKYSDPGSTIRVGAYPSNRGVSIRVSDEGIGISPEDQARLFQRFFRASDRADGTGLGLYMSRAIVEAHKGTIQVESELGSGSTFTIELPRHPS